MARQREWRWFNCKRCNHRFKLFEDTEMCPKCTSPEFDVEPPAPPEIDQAVSAEAQGAPAPPAPSPAPDPPQGGTLVDKAVGAIAAGAQTVRETVAEGAHAVAQAVLPGSDAELEHLRQANQNQGRMLREANDTIGRLRASVARLETNNNTLTEQLAERDRQIQAPSSDTEQDEEDEMSNPGGGKPPMWPCECGNRNPDRNKHCGECGKARPAAAPAAPAASSAPASSPASAGDDGSWMCPQCNSGNIPSNFFCGKCGNPHPALAPRLGGQQPQQTSQQGGQQPQQGQQQNQNLRDLI